MKINLVGICLVGGVAVSALGGGGCAKSPDDPLNPPGTDGGNGFIDSSLPDVGCEHRCSADLHSVVDCNNAKVVDCPQDQGCGPGGACVPACDAANATKGSIGCDYYAMQPGIADACFAIIVANTWPGPVNIQVEYQNQTLDVSDFGRVVSGNYPFLIYAPIQNNQIPAGQVAILFVSGQASSSLPACPVTPPIPHRDLYGTGIGPVFHVTTDRPVAAYDIFPYGGAISAMASATLLLPTSVWDTNYVAVTAYDTSQKTFAQPELRFVAMEDGTQLTISPTAAIDGREYFHMDPTAKGVPHTYTFDKGEEMAFVQDGILTGSVVQSNHPIGMWASMDCFNIPVDTEYCDSAHQQIPPVKSLGSEYVAVRYRNRRSSQPEETPPWRIMGLVDDTTLSWDPSPPAGAPTTIRQGELVTFNSAGPFIVKSQDDLHPFYLSGHMTSCRVIAPDDNEASLPEGCAGDPEFVNVVPAKQFLTSYLFFADYTYPESDLVFVREKAADGTFHDVSLDCLGTISNWKDVGTSGQYQYTRVDLVRHNFENQGSCSNGRREAHSDTPFGITVWGWGTAETGDTQDSQTRAVSYAYPGGAGVQVINNVVLPPVPR